jgi:hypothetical protein
LTFRSPLLLAALLVAACTQHPITSGLPAQPDTELGKTSRFRNPEEIAVVGAVKRPDPISRAFPKYPSDLERNQISGAAIVAYVIDTTGYVEIETASFLDVTRQEFADAVCDYLPKIRYAPFVVVDKKVRILIVQTHLFMVSRDPDSPEIVNAERLRSRSEEEFAKIPIIAVVDTLRKLRHCVAQQP